LLGTSPPNRLILFATISICSEARIYLYVYFTDRYQLLLAI